MAADKPENPASDAKPPKKTKWYWTVLWLVVVLWPLGGYSILLLRDIPLLLFLGVVIGLLQFPLARCLGRPSRHWINVVWVIGVVLGTIALVALVIPPFSISKQTTCLIEPRSKEFHGIDYSAVIEKQLEPGVPAEENGFRVLLETFGRPVFADRWDNLCRYLDLPTEIEPKLSFVDWAVFVKTLEPEEMELTEEAPWNDGIPPLSDEAIPFVRRWLDANDAALDTFGEAVRKPVFYVPPMFGDSLIQARLVFDSTCGRMANGLQLRVRYRLAVGEIDGAWDDVLTIYRLSERHRRAVWCILSSLINNQVLERANRSAEAVLIRSGWTSGEIRRKAGEIEPFLHVFRDDEIKSILLNERFIALDSIQQIANGIDDFQGPAAEDESFPYRLFLKFKMRTCRLGIVMTGMNRRFDELERQFFSDFPIPTDEQETPDIRKILGVFVRYGQFGMVPVLIGRVMENMLVPNIAAWRTSLKTREAGNSLLRLFFALEAYRRDHDGNFPESPDDLQGRYLDEMPVDPFSKTAFRYVLLEPEDGKPEVLFYGVGPNGLDEDGRDGNDMPRGDDIRRRLSE